MHLTCLFFRAFFSLLCLLVVTSSLYHAWYHSEACNSARYARLNEPLDEESVVSKQEVSANQVLPGDSQINKDNPRSERAATEGMIFNFVVVIPPVILLTMS